MVAPDSMDRSIEYEIGANLLVQSATRYFQAQALFVTVAGAPLALLSAGVGSGLNSWILAAVSVFELLYAFYWMNNAARFRIDENVVQRRLREIEPVLGFRLFTDLWLDVRETN